MNFAVLSSTSLMSKLVWVGTCGLCLACGEGGPADGEQAVPRESVVKAYAELVEANYADALDRAKALRAALRDLESKPSRGALSAAKVAWLDARDPYGETEAFRFYEGPIDNVMDGPEGLINAWPIDENYIDYVVDENEVISGGIINLPDDYPVIDEELLTSLNEKDGEANISTGYHAIEFLLWGQDRSADGPGERPFTDYVTGPAGTAENQDRRAQYLLTAADMLVAHLTTVHDAWLPDQPNYRADFEALVPAEALGNMLLGMGSLAGAELAGERMSVAYENKAQEDEHSCFSDNTKADLRNNAKSVQNVLLGQYGELDGPGVDELIAAKDPALAQELRDQIQQALDDIEAIPGSFDQAILGKDQDEGRMRVDSAIVSLRAFTTTLAKAAIELDVELKLE